MDIERIKTRLTDHFKRNEGKARRRYGAHFSVDLWAILLVAEHFNWRCPYCSVSLENVDLHFDHIQTKSLEGKHIDHNLLIVCAKCNIRKHAKPLDVWLNEIGVDPDSWRDVHTKAANEIMRIKIERVKQLNPAVGEVMEQHFHQMLAAMNG